MSSYRFLVYGRVQGVYYRKFVSQRVRELSFKGFIRNLPNGSVEVVVRVNKDDIKEIKRILLEGSPMSEVKDIKEEILERDDLIYDSFEIRY